MDLYESKLKSISGVSPNVTIAPLDLPGEMFRYSDIILTNRFALVN